MMESKNFEGVMCPLCVPLDADEKIIEGDLIKQIERVLKAGVTAILAPSGTGEVQALSPDECIRQVEIVSSVAKDKALIVSLQSSCSTKQLLKLFEAAAKAGADAVMATPPYFDIYDQRGLESFYTDLARESGLPVWIYNQPGHTKLMVEPETIASLARNAGIVGVKDSAGPDMFHFQGVMRATEDLPDFRISMGEDDNALFALAMGGHGMTATISNMIPESCVGIYRAMKEGDLEKARKFQKRITEVNKAITGPHPAPCLQSVCKYILKRMGIFSSDIVARPYLLLTKEERKGIDKIIDKLGPFC